MIENTDKLMADVDVPTLIVGWRKVKELFPEQRISNKIINDKTFWTFSEKERKSEYLTDIQWFNRKCVEYLDKKYVYHFINNFDLTLTNFKSFLTRLSENTTKILQITDKEIFILMDNRLIAGLNIEFLKKRNITIDKIKKYLTNREYKIIENYDFFSENSIFNIKDTFKSKLYLTPVIKNRLDYEKKFIIGYIFK